MTKQSAAYLVLLSLFLLIFIRLIPGHDLNNGSSYRALPRPIVEGSVLITSAGQSTDIYVIKDMANQLMVENYFSPAATAGEVQSMGTVILVVGDSELGRGINELDQEAELVRLQTIIDVIQSKDLVLVTVYMRDALLGSDLESTYLEMVIPYTDYMISTDDSGYMKDLTYKYGCDLTVVSDVNDISEPLVSVFR